MITNSQLAELLAARAEKEERGSQRQRALGRASRAALLWVEEAGDVAAAGRPLTELARVGPWTAGLLEDWLADDSPPAPPPPIRAGFRSLAEARRRLAGNQGGQRLRADLQMHTTFTDGHSSLAEMVTTCAARGYEYIAVTDHTETLRVARGMSPDQFAGQWQEMEVIQRHLEATGSTMQVLRSAEVNLDPEGRADMPAAFLDSLDVVLAAFHSKLRLKEDQTDRYLAALENPRVHILGHPRGRMYNHRLGLSADWHRVMTRAAELDKALEIDAYADRQDLDVDLLRVAADTGVRISIGSDAHHVVDLPSVDIGLASAFEAGIGIERILPLQPLDSLREWVAGLRSAT